MDERPNPDRLLRYANQEERAASQGKLKIYLGAAPGVGKTYSMLQDAINKLSQGVDVVVGIVESHGRSEIDKLIAKFEVLPRLNVEYHNKTLKDFDLDAALKRNPGLILMDEMAHTNAPGLRHTKRWQDIKELLDRGIDVSTTLNVQHIESLNDIVAQILHTQIKETVPDSMIELAHTIELIDLPPEDLIKRLQEGKVYFPEQIELAKNSFFREGNLYALRELALRTTAQRVNAQVLLYRHGKGIKHIWPSNEKILVCVGPGSESVKMIRTARRIATDMQAEWIAVYVDVPQIHSDPEKRNSAIQYLRLAEQLGGQTQILNGFNIVDEIMSFSREQNITQIIVAKKIRPRWRELFSKSLADEIIRASHEIDVYIVSGEKAEEYKWKRGFEFTSELNTYAYLVTIATVAFITLINAVLFSFFSTSNLIMMFLLGLMVISLFGEVGPALLGILLSVLSYDYFFIKPYMSFLAKTSQDYLNLAMMFLVSLVICYLTIRNRKQARNAKRLQQQTASLHTLSRQLASTRGVDKLLAVGLQYIGDTFASDVMALLPVNNELKVRAKYKTGDISLDSKETGVAQWVVELGQKAGLGTDTLPFSNSLYIPLLAAQGTIGVLRIHPENVNKLITPQEAHMLEACANQIALAIEVDRMEETAKENILQKESDKIRSMLLQSLSHDLRAPLIAIQGSARTLEEMAHQLDRKSIHKLATNINAESTELNRLIVNILQISYLEEGSYNIQKTPNSIKQLIGVVINSLSDQLIDHEIIVDVPDNLPLIPFDNSLIQEVIENLLDNAMKFTPPKSTIGIKATLEREYLIISIEDEGPGIVLDEVNNLFEKFYRGRMRTTERGLGLGLAICKLIILAHGGAIWAENRREKGSAFKFSLPIH